jgi:hypothetical protein
VQKLSVIKQNAKNAGLSMCCFSQKPLIVLIQQPLKELVPVIVGQKKQHAATIRTKMVRL